MASVFGVSGGGENAGWGTRILWRRRIRSPNSGKIPPEAAFAHENDATSGASRTKNGPSARFPAAITPRRTEKARLAPCFSGSQTQPEKAEPAVRSRVQNPTGHSGGSKAGGLRRKKAARCWRGVCQADEKGSYETWLLKKKGGKEKKKKNQENQPTCRRTCAPRKYPLLGARWCSRLLFF